MDNPAENEKTVYILGLGTQKRQTSDVNDAKKLASRIREAHDG
jgi:hypothetical protein